MITVRDSNSHKLKNVNGTFARIKNENHFLYYYYEYICHIYEVLPNDRTMLFANDTFCSNYSDINELNSKIKKVKSGEILNLEEQGYTSLYKI